MVNGLDSRTREEWQRELGLMEERKLREDLQALYFSEKRLEQDGAQSFLPGNKRKLLW